MKTRARVASKMDVEENVHNPDIPSTNVKCRKVDGGKSSSMKPSVIVPSKKSGRGHSKKIEDVKPDIGETVSEKEQKHCSENVVDDLNDILRTSVGSKDTTSETADTVESELPRAQRNSKKEQIVGGKRGNNKRKPLDAIESSAVVSKVEHKTKFNSVIVKSECIEETLANDELKKRNLCENLSTIDSGNVLQPKNFAMGKKFVGAHVSIAGEFKLLMRLFMSFLLYFLFERLRRHGAV